MATTRPPAWPQRETDLYAPLRDFLTAQGYTVRGEVQHCDLTARRGDELVIVELKLRANLDLLVQATARQRLTGTVYVALPRPTSRADVARERGVRRVLRQLELGLLWVAHGPGGPHVEVVFHPLPAERRRQPAKRAALLHELERRSGDFNPGGSTRRKLLTAYRESALRVAWWLSRRGALSPRELRARGTGPATLGLLRRNVYGWFERLDRGIYGLTAAGRQALKDYAALVAQWHEEAPASAAPPSVASAAAPAAPAAPSPAKPDHVAAMLDRLFPRAPAP